MVTQASASTILDSKTENLGSVTLSWVGVGGEGCIEDGSAKTEYTIGTKFVV